MRQMQILFVVASFFFVACNGEIPMVGLDANGKQIETMAKSADFEGYLTQGLNDLQESTIPTLDQVPGGKEWFLREARIGLGLQGSVGIGDFFKMGGNIGFRLCFANKP